MIAKTKTGSEFQIDEQDAHLLKMFPRISEDFHGYIKVSSGGQHYLLHRLITNCPDHMVVDHINHDKKDNRRENLRICTRSQNNKNIKKPNIENATSKYKGVRWHKGDKKWSARIQVDKKGYWLGNFDTEEAAAERYDDAAEHFFGIYALFNFPNRPRQPYVKSIPHKKHSNVKGISFDIARKSNQWSACIQVNGIRWQKRFQTEQEAIAALEKYKLEQGII